MISYCWHISDDRAAEEFRYIVGGCALTLLLAPGHAGSARRQRREICGRPRSHASSEDVMHLLEVAVPVAAAVEPVLLPRVRVRPVAEPPEFADTDDIIINILSRGDILKNCRSAC